MGDIKITDFGLAVVLKDGSESEIRKQPIATRWCSPETVAYSKLSHRSDVWSFGAMLWEMCANAAPWVLREKRASVATRLKDIAENSGAEEGGTDVSGDFPAQTDIMPEFHEGILSCFVADEGARPSFVQLAEVFETMFAKETGVSEEQIEAPEDESGEPD